MKSWQSICFIGLLSMAWIFVPNTVTHAKKKLSGQEIMRRSLALSELRDMKGNVTLTLEASSGYTRNRSFVMFSKDEKAKKRRNMYMRFRAPADVRGIAMLIKEYANRGDDIYLYLPSLRRVTRITGTGRGGAFMDSDFNYSDITRPKLHEWTYRRRPNAKVNGKKCYVVICTAKNRSVIKETGYWRVVRWIDKVTLSTVKAEYYDTRKKVFKRLTVNKIKMFGKLPFATDMEMTNINTKHKSRLVFKDLRANIGLSRRIFSLRTLLRGR